MGHNSHRGVSFFPICQCLTNHFKIKKTNFVSGLHVDECYETNIDYVMPNTTTLPNDARDDVVPCYLCK